MSMKINTDYPRFRCFMLGPDGTVVSIWPRRTPDCTEIPRLPELDPLSAAAMHSGTLTGEATS